MKYFVAVLVLCFCCCVECGNYGWKECETKSVTCFKPDFPNFDGTCNNLMHPTWGATGSVLRRLLPAKYADGIGKPKTQGAMGKLPSPREISNILTKVKKTSPVRISHMHVLFGQLLAHDLVLTPQIKNSEGGDLDCNCRTPNKDCFNINVPKNDPQFIQAGKTCLPFSRSKSAKGADGCEFNKREQFNAISSVIDATFLYAETKKKCNELRDRKASEELMLSENPADPVHKNLPNQNDLPHSDAAGAMACPMKVHKPVDVPCFVSGDNRLNENPGLQSLLTIFARYHNKIANGLKELNPWWTSDKIFDTARAIITALTQSITYREYLPPLLGPLWMKRFDLVLPQGGYWNGYDAKYDTTIINEFATAAFRYGHSQVTATMTRPGSFFQKTGRPDVKGEGSFFNNEPLLDQSGGGSGAFMRGFMLDTPEKADLQMTDSLRNGLLAHRGEIFGRDLLAANVQRGRDHGLPGYNKYRELCGLPKAVSFDSLLRNMPLSTVKKLKLAYQHVDDIDLFIGGLAENNVEGGEIGPTFACILAYNFRALRKGDRFWHEYKHSPTKFTPGQLDTIRRTTLASIICEAGEDMTFVFPNSMLLNAESGTPITDCAAVPKIDLRQWHHLPQQFVATGSEHKWTTWFVTNFWRESQIDAAAAWATLSNQMREGLCEQFVTYETRMVPGDYFLQIRFFCPTGTISGSDFPFELSENHYWTPWVHAIRGWFGGQTVKMSQFICKEPVAIQAKEKHSMTFAGETGDVFMKFSHTTGFSCHDSHQLIGRCRNYKVRALCKDKPLQEFTTISNNLGENIIMV